eukprot:304678-Hanusia_phi.AAC.1
MVLEVESISKRNHARPREFTRRLFRESTRKAASAALTSKNVAAKDRGGSRRRREGRREQEGRGETQGRNQGGGRREKRNKRIEEGGKFLFTSRAFLLTDSRGSKESNGVGANKSCGICQEGEVGGGKRKKGEGVQGKG